MFLGKDFRIFHTTVNDKEIKLDPFKVWRKMAPLYSNTGFDGSQRTPLDDLVSGDLLKSMTAMTQIGPTLYDAFECTPWSESNPDGLTEYEIVSVFIDFCKFVDNAKKAQDLKPS